MMKTVVQVLSAEEADNIHKLTGNDLVMYVEDLVKVAYYQGKRDGEVIGFKKGEDSKAIRSLGDPRD